MEGTTTPKFSPVLLWQVATIAVIVVLAVSVVTKGFSFTGGTASSELTAQQAAAKAITYINNLLEGQSTATLIGVNESNGLYNVKLDVGGQQYNSYITKDGSILFPSAYQLPATVNSTTITNSSTANSTTGSSYPKSDKPTVQFFVMAFCPYGQQAETGLIGAWQALGDTVNWEPHYVIYENYQSAQYCLDANMTYCSMHGRSELNEDVRQMCIWKYYNASVWWNYVSQINTICSASNVDTCWLNIANATGINTTQIASCQTNEAVVLLEAEKALDAQMDVSGSPAIFVNGKSYSGARSADAFKSAICSAFNTAPAACNQTLSTNTSASTGGCGG